MSKLLCNTNEKHGTVAKHDNATVHRRADHWPTPPDLITTDVTLSGVLQNSTIKTHFGVENFSIPTTTTRTSHLSLRHYFCCHCSIFSLLRAHLTHLMTAVPAVNTPRRVRNVCVGLLRWTCHLLLKLLEGTRFPNRNARGAIQEIVNHTTINQSARSARLYENAHNTHTNAHRHTRIRGEDGGATDGDGWDYRCKSERCVAYGISPLRCNRIVVVWMLRR